MTANAKPWMPSVKAIQSAIYGDDHERTSEYPNVEALISRAALDRAITEQAKLVPILCHYCESGLVPSRHEELTHFRHFLRNGDRWEGCRASDVHVSLAALRAEREELDR